MTIVSTGTVEHYTGDGIQAQWPVPFPFHRPEDVRATVSGPEGGRLLAYGTEYTVVALPGGGGTLTCTAETVRAGDGLAVWLDQPFTQEMDLRNTGVLDAEMLERGFDKLTLMAQQLREEVGRCVKVPIGGGQPLPDSLLESIATGAGRAAGAAESAADRASAAACEAGRAELARTGAEAALAGAQAARDAASGAAVATRAEVLASAAFVPIGAILDFPVNTVPAGFLVCAGQEVAKSAYPELVAYLTGGPTALSATVPDYRGTVSRAADLGRGLASDVVVGGYLPDAFQGHGHEQWRNSGDVFSGGGSPGIGASASTNAKIGDSNVRGAVADGSYGTPRVAGETRGKSYGVVRCIKAYHAPMSAAPVDMTAILTRLSAIERSGAEAKQPQTIMRCRLAPAMAFPNHDLALPDFLTFSGLNVTLQADAANPFAVCFGNGGSSVTAEITGNLSRTLPGHTTTNWLYVERNPDTGALSLGASIVPPEYGPARRGVAVLGAAGNVIGTMTADAGNAAAFNGVENKTSAAQCAGCGGGTTAYVGKDFVSPVCIKGVRVMPTAQSALGFTNDAPNVTVSLVASNSSDPNTATQVLTTGMIADSGSLVVRLFDASLTAAYRYWWVKVVPNVTNSVWVAHVEWLSTDDWYSPPENVMRSAANAQVQRVYVGKAVVSGGVITSVTPFHPGRSAIVPVNGGGLLAAGVVYAMDNPFGVGDPYASAVFQYLGGAMTSWGIAPEYYDSPSGYGFFRRRVARDSIRLSTGSGGAGSDDAGLMALLTAARARVIVERGF